MIRVINKSGKGQSTEIYDTTTGKNISKEFGIYKWAGKTDVYSTVRFIFHTRKVTTDITGYIQSISCLFIDPVVGTVREVTIEERKSPEFKKKWGIGALEVECQEEKK